MKQDSHEGRSSLSRQEATTGEECDLCPVNINSLVGIEQSADGHNIDDSETAPLQQPDTQSDGYQTLLQRINDVPKFSDEWFRLKEQEISFRSTMPDNYLGRSNVQAENCQDIELHPAGDIPILGRDEFNNRGCSTRNRESAEINDCGDGPPLPIGMISPSTVGPEYLIADGDGPPQPIGMAKVSNVSEKKKLNVQDQGLEMIVESDGPIVSR
jgi:hypothetical protein